MSEIKNLLFVSNHLSCAGQPDESQLTQIAAQGFEVVINLGLINTKYALPDEAASVSKLGLEYYHIPVLFENPRFSELESFIAILNQQRPRKTFIHCAANYRATAFTGLYLFAISEIDQVQLQSFIGQIWHPDPVWQQFIDDAVRQLKPSAL
jgi:protein tyrosine phosphatase (PTP) superfamily phosphohydrolase (DUF442 family)